MEARHAAPRRWSWAVTIFILVVWVWFYEVTGPRELAIALLVSCLVLLSHRHRRRLVVAFAPPTFWVYKDLVTCRPDFDGAHALVNDWPMRIQNIVGDIASDLGYVDLTPAFVKEIRR